MIEAWKFIPGYEGLYQASDLGNIKSVARTRKTKSCGRCEVKEKILKPGLSRQHLIVRLSKNGNVKTFYIHTLVLISFVGPKPTGMECRHFPDKDYRNNVLSNLSWGTPKQNGQDRIFHGSIKRGENHKNAVLTERQVVEMRKLHATGKWSFLKLQKKYKVGYNTVVRAIRRKTWLHVGEK